MKKLLAFSMSVMLLASSFGGIRTVRAADAVAVSSPRLGDVTNAVLDESNGYIYVTAGDKLLFVQLDELRVDHELQTGGKATDLDLDNGLLYVTLGSKIEVVDTSAKAVQKELPIEAYKTEVDGSSLYAVSDKDSTKVTKVDLQTNEKKESDGTYQKPDLAIDRVNHLLYVAESGVTGAVVTALDSDLKVQSASTYKDGAGFNAPKRNVVLHGDSVYYSGHALNASRLQTVKGEYNGNETVLTANANVVVTEKAIYDRSKYVKITDLPFAPKFALVDSKNQLYLIDNATQTMVRRTFDLQLQPTKQEMDYNIAMIEGGISDWAADEARDRIYAVSESKNKLYWISMVDLAIEKEIYIGSKPTDVDLTGGKLYIALYGSTKAVVLDAASGNVEDTFDLETNPYQIEVGTDKMFYAGKDGRQTLRVYDMKTKTSQKIAVAANQDYVTSPSLYLDKSKNMLYVGEATGSGSGLYAVNADTYEPVNKNISLNIKQRNLVKEGADLYFGGSRFDEKDITKSLVTFNDTLVYADGPYAVGHHGIYDRDTAEEYAYWDDDEISLAYMDLNGQFFLYSSQDQTIEIVPPPMDSLYRFFPEDAESSWARDKLVDFIHADLIKGYENEDGSYSVRPGNKITRAEFVTMLVNGLGAKTDKPGKAFKDVPKGTWYAEPIRIATALGIVKGVDASHFAPMRNVKRDEMATMIVQAFAASVNMSGPAKTFPDVPVYWATPFIEKASKAGIIGGDTNGKFNPQSPATRAEAVQMLYTALRKQQSDLPSDEELKNAVLQSEQAYYDKMKQYDFEGLYDITEQHTIGYYEEFANYVTDNLIDLQLRGFRYETKQIGTPTAKVMFKSNSFAIVELNGVTYEYVASKGEFTKTLNGDASTVMLLRKDPKDGKWKQYSTLETE